ncbi:MAG: ATP-binding protein [Verrucomicrobiae bacterium]
MNKRPLNISVGGTINRIRQQRFPLQSALLEMIDNALDAGATTITIREKNDNLFIEDNGHGFEDVSAAFDIGESGKEGKLGRYGVGLKDASVKYSTETTISSRGRMATCSWDDALETGYANIVSEDRQEQQTTEIIWWGFRNLYGYPIATDEIRRCYAKSLSNGVTIEINGSELDPLPLPAFSENLSQEFNYEGKTVELTGGIFPHGDAHRRAWAGYNIYYNGRLIGPGRVMTHGTGDIGCSNFSFMVHLKDGPESKWALATNKDEVPGSDELLDFIFHTYTRPLLVKAQAQTMDVELREIKEAIESSIGGCGNITRSPHFRRRIDPEAKDHAAGSPKKRTFSASGQGQYQGTATGKMAQGGINLAFADLNSESVGEVAMLKKLLVTLNKQNTFVAGHLKNLPVMKAIAIIVFAMSQAAKDLFSQDVINRVLEIAGRNLTLGESDAAK